MDALSDASTARWLAFSLSAPPGAARFREIRERYPDPTELGCWLVTGTDLSGFDHRSFTHDAVGNDRYHAALAWQAAAPGRTLLALEHPAYPEALAALSDAPILLYARGDLTLLEQPLLAVVGSRRASRGALSLTARWCEELAAASMRRRTVVLCLHPGGVPSPSSPLRLTVATHPSTPNSSARYSNAADSS